VRVLVTGGTGLLGYWVTKAFGDRGFDVYSTYHERSPPEVDVRWVRLDLEDFESITRVVKEVKPEVIVHTAAYTDVDGCEVNKEKAYRVNYLATKVLANASRAADLFVYISTDYVFDGSRGMYREEDVPAPINYYGLTKLLGEVASLSSTRSSCIVRVSGLYGYSPVGKRNFGVVALEKLAKGGYVEAFIDQVLSPTYIKFLAEKLVKVVELRVTGVLHIAGDRLSRYEFATMLADVLGVSRDLVRPKRLEEVRFTAPRPRDSSLDTSKAGKLGLALPPTSECLKDMVSTYRMFTEGGR